MSSQSSRRGRSTLSFGYICLLVGCLFGVVGALWQVPHVTRTDGVITESVALAGALHTRLITYEYTAYGMRHRGQRLFGWGRSIPASFYEVGQSFPVFFVTDNPDSSYAPWPPGRTVFVVFAVGFGALGITVILFAWRLRHLTNR